MRKDSQQKLDEWFRDGGKELEAAMNAAGSSLPAGLSGETFIREILEEAQRRARSPEGQAMSNKIRRIMEEVLGELPGGIENPAFVDRMRTRMEDALRRKQDGSDASA